jgi:hypothetical protein
MAMDEKSNTLSVRANPTMCCRAHHCDMFYVWVLREQAMLLVKLQARVFTERCSAVLLTASLHPSDLHFCFYLHLNTQ